MTDIIDVPSKYIIRIYDMDLCSDWVSWKGGARVPKKYISRNELIKDLNDNGLTIHKYTFSLLGDCYFFEVSGEYTGKIEYERIPCNFCWRV